MQIGVFVGLLFGLIIAFFAALNTEPVTLNYYFGQAESSLALLMILSAVAGALIVGLFGLIRQIGTGFAMWDFKNKHARLVKEVEALKEQKRALSDDLDFLQAEYENTMRQKELERENLVKELQKEEIIQQAEQEDPAEADGGEPWREE